MLDNSIILDYSRVEVVADIHLELEAQIMYPVLFCLLCLEKNINPP